MKHFIVVGSSVLWLGVAAAQAVAARPKVDPSLQATARLEQSNQFPPSISVLEVENPSGSIHIHGSYGQTPNWSWSASARAGSDAQSQEIARHIHCTAQVDGTHVKLTVTAPEAVDPRAIESDFYITVPKATSVRTRTRDGLTDITDLAADVKVIDSNGPVGIHRVAGHVTAETSGARLAVSAVNSATLRNNHGEIEAWEIDGALDAKTSFGPLTAENVEGAAALTNDSGNIKATFIGGGLDATAAMGTIVAHDIEGAVQIRDQNGSVDLAKATPDFDTTRTTETLGTKS
jgi:hypothetical protein